MWEKMIYIYIYIFSMKEILAVEMVGREE